MNSWWLHQWPKSCPLRNWRNKKSLKNIIWLRSLEVELDWQESMASFPIPQILGTKRMWACGLTLAEWVTHQISHLEELKEIRLLRRPKKLRTWCLIRLLTRPKYFHTLMLAPLIGIQDKDFRLHSRHIHKTYSKPRWTLITKNHASSTRPCHFRGHLKSSNIVMTIKFSIHSSRESRLCSLLLIKLHFMEGTVPFDRGLIHLQT